MSRDTADLVGFAAKGRIAVGADADLLVHDTARTPSWWPTGSRTATRSRPTTGSRFPGRVTTTLVRGRAVDAERPDRSWGRQLKRTAVDPRPPELDVPPRLLMGPGPINADPRVLRAMSAPLVGQFDPFDDRLP